MNNNTPRDYLRDLENMLYEKQIEVDKLDRQLEDYKVKYNTINNSTIWRATFPLRCILDRAKAVNSISLAIKVFKYYRNNGLRRTVLKVKAKIFGASKVIVSDSYDLPSGYNSVYQNEENLLINSNVKVLAFNLPQFHSFPENDEWWGKGFTEWTNTRKALPCYDKHYEPREPHEDIGYYDLSTLSAVKKQAEMAKRHGLYGFCYYYYWFSGKRLMEKPVDILLAHPEIDINFCLCWANENWTRTWDGLDKNVLIEQKYLDSDPESFILDIRKYIADSRYIRWREKPVIVIYAPKSLPNVKSFIEKAKKAALDIGIGDISFWICKSPGVSIHELGLDFLVDREIEFPPHSQLNDDIVYLKNIKGYTIDYSKSVDRLLRDFEKEKYNYRNIRTVMLGWDNAARKEKEYYSFDNFDIFKYYQWLLTVVKETEKKYLPDDRFVFINAWNEWAEGTYLEPDKKYGYASINTTSRAIGKLPFGISFQKKNNTGKNKSEIFVQVHMFYVELVDEFISYLNNISEPFDCYITTDTIAKAKLIFEKFSKDCNANFIQIDLFPNKGRDVAPFLLQINERFKNYKYFAHIHSKKSLYDSFGRDWRAFLLNTLLGNKGRVDSVIGMLRRDSNLGLIYPKPFYEIEKNFEWGGDYLLLKDLMENLGLPFTVSETEKPVFPAGNMFWAKTDAVKQLLGSRLTLDDFPNEMGQIDGTLMHAIERSWIYIADANGFASKTISDE